VAGPSFYKHPIEQMADDEAFERLERFIRNS
jgi:hypothetical protein